VADAFDGSELEFWVGTWDVAWAVDGGGAGAGTNRISRILGDRVIHEQFEGGDANSAMRGESWSVFDAERHLWRQTWVDDQGGYLDLVGELAEGCFAFVRASPERGVGARQRMVFRDVALDRFRWTWEFSPDDGATWVTRWEIAYQRAG
jgi:hypothetical protein